MSDEYKTPPETPKMPDHLSDLNESPTEEELAYYRAIEAYTRASREESYEPPMEIMEENKGPSLGEVVQNLRATLKDGNTIDNADDYAELLSEQTRVLDGAFYHFLNNVKHDEKDIRSVQIALQAQRQIQRAILTWRSLQTLKQQ